MLEEMASFFEKRLSDYDTHMLTEIEGAAAFYPYTAAQLPQAEQCEILDLGCGTGLELEPYFALNPSARVTAIDLSQGMLDALRRKFSARPFTLLCGSYFDVPLGRERFDAAVSVESLHHFTAEQKTALYKRVFDALRDGGFLILTDYFAESPEHERAYFEELARLRAAQNLSGASFYHYDTPLTVEHEIQALQAAGFADCAVLNRWGATRTLKAQK